MGPILGFLIFKKIQPLSKKILLRMCAFWDKTHKMSAPGGNFWGKLPSGLEFMPMMGSFPRWFVFVPIIAPPR